MDTGSLKDAEITATRTPEVMERAVAGKPKATAITTGNPKDAAMMVTRRSRSDPQGVLKRAVRPSRPWQGI